MNWPLVIFLGLGCATGLIIVGNFVFYSILGEINGKSSEGQQISIWGVNVRAFMVLKRHTEFFPQSRKRAQMWGYFVAGLLLFLSTLLVGALHYSSH
jgi:hypothetical protein